MPRFTDMLGREIILPARPQRIISLVPSQTELLYDLGLEEEVTGITKFCVHPQKWFREKTRVGGTKTANIEKIAALKPDLIIANKEENEKAQIEALQAIAPVWVSDIKSLEDACRMIKMIGGICEKAEAAKQIIDKIVAGFATLRTGYTAVKTAYCIWRNPWMWAGGDTFINDILKRCGLENVLASTSRYPEVSLVELQALNPALVLLSSEPYPFKAQHIAEIKAVLPEAKVLLADGEIFSWYGSRLLHAPKYIAGLLEAL